MRPVKAVESTIPFRAMMAVVRWGRFPKISSPYLPTVVALPQDATGETKK